MKRMIIITIILAGTWFANYGQEAGISRKGLTYIVPEMSLWLGPFATVDLAPQVGYHLTDRWSVGAGLHYKYFKNYNYFVGSSWSTHMVGAKLFTRIDLLRNAQDFLPFYLFNDLFVHLEYEGLSLERRYFDAPVFPEAGRFWEHNLFAGVGITQRTGELSGYSFMVLWNLNNQYYTPYSNPTYRVGFNIYLRPKSENIPR